MLDDKRIKYPLLVFVLTELIIGILEQISGVPLNEFGLLRLAFIQITDVLLPLMPTTGPFAEAGDKMKFVTDVVSFILYFLPGIFTAIIVYMKVRDEE